MGVIFLLVNGTNVVYEKIFDSENWSMDSKEDNGDMMSMKQWGAREQCPNRHMSHSV